MAAKRDYNSYISMDWLTSPSSLECLPADLLSNLTNSLEPRRKRQRRDEGDTMGGQTHTLKKTIWVSAWVGEGGGGVGT
jgi:hypothetical protein